MILRTKADIEGKTQWEGPVSPPLQVVSGCPVVMREGSAGQGMGLLRERRAGVTLENAC